MESSVTGNRRNVFCNLRLSERVTQRIESVNQNKRNETDWPALCALLLRDASGGRKQKNGRTRWWRW